MGWEDVAAHLCGQQAELHSRSCKDSIDIPPQSPAQSDSESVAACWREVDGLRSESEAECSQSTDAGGSHHNWWCSQIMKHLSELQLELPKRADPLTLVSCCSGCCAEATVLEDCRAGGGHRSLSTM